MMMRIISANSSKPFWNLRNPNNPLSSSAHSSILFSTSKQVTSFDGGKRRNLYVKRARIVVCSGLLPVDPWAPSVDSQSIASQLFALSLFPYLGFLYFMTKSNTAPKLTLFGFYFLLAFVGATIPAGIYAKVHYGTSLSNVDWLHGGAESLLTLSNLFVVLGLREAIRKAENAEETETSLGSDTEKETSSSS